MTNKIYDAIKNLPDDPKEPIYWVCYNEDMIAGAEKMISLIKGESYLDKCQVITRNKSEIPESNSQIYYSPDLHDHIGNGAN